MTFLLAHVSDPHIGPLPPIPLRHLLNKRLTGVLNWHRARSDIHNMAVLDKVLGDVLDQKPDHIALTGDLVNVGYEDEFPHAFSHVKVLGSPRDVSIIPGNHDTYTRSSLGAMCKTFGAYMRGDDTDLETHADLNGIVPFPYLRIRGDVALIGVNSGIPTAPFMATGMVGRAQREALTRLLRSTKAQGLMRVVMVHHPALPGGTRFGRWLKDRVAFGRLLHDERPDLVIHGHNHRFSVMYADAARKAVPVVGVASASAVPGTPHHRAEYHLYRIERAQTGAKITVIRRGYDNETGKIVIIDEIQL